MYEFCFLELPFRAKTEGLQLYRIFQVLGSPDDETLEKFKRDCPFEMTFWDSFKGFEGDWEFQERIQAVDPSGKFFDLLSLIWSYSPEDRPTAE